MASKVTPVRILSEVQVDSANYKPNQVVGFSPRVASRLVKEGNADDSDDAVDYCLSTGAKPVLHADGDAAGEGDAQPASSEQ